MNCRGIRQWLHSYLDARVDPNQERMIERHIRSCAHCRRRLVELARAVNLMEDQQLVGPGPDFLRKVFAGLPGQVEFPSPHRLSPAARVVAAWRRLFG
ncbi:MAG: zf-HC2 domain-containing protein [bacterium]|nr:zf-HC2 domain-containing protein [bacterium]